MSGKKSTRKQLGLKDDAPKQKAALVAKPENGLAIPVIALPGDEVYLLCDSNRLVTIIGPKIIKKVETNESGTGYGIDGGVYAPDKIFTSREAAFKAASKLQEEIIENLRRQFVQANAAKK